MTFLSLTRFALGYIWRIQHAFLHAWKRQNVEVVYITVRVGLGTKSKKHKMQKKNVIYNILRPFTFSDDWMTYLMRDIRDARRKRVAYIINKPCSVSWYWASISVRFHYSGTQMDEKITRFWWASQYVLNNAVRDRSHGSRGICIAGIRHSV